MGFIFRGIKYVITIVIKQSILLAIFAAVILLIPNLPPYTKFTSIELEPTQPRVGPLAPNGALNNARHLYKGKLLGPEAFQVYNGEVYTSVHTGEVLKLSPGGHVTFVTKIGRPCTDLSQEHICGRPLGFKIDEKTQQMYVVDAYYGIWKVDLKTDKKQLLVSPQVEIEGKQPKLFNDLTLSKTKAGDLYYTVSSSDFLLHDGAFAGLADPSGRLLHYDAAKNKSTVLLDNLWLANGVVVSPDNQFVVVAESFRYRLLKYYLEGPKKGKSEVFVAGLPGAPDNIRALPDGSGVLIALYTAFDDAYPLITRSLAAAPLARKLLARVQRLVELPFEFLNAQFPNPVFESVVYNIGHFKSLSWLMPGVSGLVQVDWEGKIVASYFNNDGSLHGVSDAIVFGDQLLIGAPNLHDFVGSVPAPPLLKKAFAVKASKTAETVTKAPPAAKVESKPTKPAEQAKPKVQEKPKVEEKKEQPKVAKPSQATKPAEPVKVATPTPKPAEKKPEPKAAPTTPPPKPIEKPTTQKPPATKPVKPEQAQPKKATEKVKTDKPSSKKTDEPEIVIIREPKKPTKDIPIKEEIPSDTRKPAKEKLKVITKDGPAVIRNPEL